MARRLGRSCLGATSALILLTLASCGGSGGPGDPFDAGASPLAKTTRALDLTILPAGPHPILPTEGFGKTVAVSGARVAVADYLEFSVYGLKYPHVDTFALGEGTAVPTGKLPAVGYGELCFGAAIALDGDLLAVGEPCANGGAGAVHTYRFTDGAWVEEPLLAGAGGGFGSAIAMAANRMVVGAPNEPGNEGPSGGAWVFARTGGAWRGAARLTPGAPQAGEGFGASVAMTADSVAVAAPAYAGGASFGRTLVFGLQSDGTWLETASLLVTDGLPGDGTARSVALCSGTLLVAGDSWVEPEVHLFTRSATGWTEGDLPGGGSGLPAGRIDAVACDGDAAVIGVPWASPGEVSWVGVARVLKRTGGAWALAGEIAGAGAGERAGHAVAVSRGIVAVGVPYALVDGRAVGAVRVKRF